MKLIGRILHCRFSPPRQRCGYYAGRIVRVNATKRGAIRWLTVALAGGERHAGFDGPRVRASPAECDHHRDSTLGVLWRGKLQQLPDRLF